MGNWVLVPSKQLKQIQIQFFIEKITNIVAIIGFKCSNNFTF